MWKSATQKNKSLTIYRVEFYTSRWTEHGYAIDIRAPTSAKAKENAKNMGVSQKGMEIANRGKTA